MTTRLQTLQIASLKSSIASSVRANLQAAAYYRTGQNPAGVCVYQCQAGTTFANQMWEACMRNVRSGLRQLSR